MQLRKLGLALAAAVTGLSAFAATAPAMAEDSQFIPLLTYRTGPYAPNGIPVANAYVDYLNLINERDGGINGVKISYEECETEYKPDRGVECYERLKNKGTAGASVFYPLSTGITYALIERATADKIPIHSMGYGRADASVGSVFPYVFTFPATYWSQADAIITHIADKEGGFDKLKGKKIAFVYIDVAYGREPIPVLEKLAEQHGFELHPYPVSAPGLEQRSTWLQLGRRLKPDYAVMWGWGVMNATAIKEAAAVRFPMDKFIGVWWSGAEQDVLPAGDAAQGYKAGGFHAPGKDAPVFKDLEEHLYSKGKGMGDPDQVGWVLYNRGLVHTAYVVEAIRTAMDHFGNKPLTGEQVQWGFEHLKLTQEHIDKLGLTGLIQPLEISCDNHEGDGKLLIQQWDAKAKTWSVASDWIAANSDMLRPMYEESAMQYAKEKGIEPRDCSKVE